MAEKNVNIKIKGDGKQAKNAIQDVTSELNKFSKKAKSSDVANLSASFLGATKAVSLATNAIKKVNSAIKETEEAYRNQVKAEQQLKTAAQNNPYLDDNSVKQLKNFAGELQAMSTTGDEVLLPLMAQLAAAGRTQTEIQQIMSAALDVEASGAMSLESAVKSLNQTYGGTTGQLGKIIPQVKELTAEELKQGKGVEVVANMYKGMAAEVAKSTGSVEQLHNAWGDFKEEIGAGFEKQMAPMRRFFTQLITGWTNAKKARREYNEAEEKVDAGNATSADYKTLIDQKQKQLDDLIAYENQKLTESEQRLKDWADFWGTTIDDENLPPLPPDFEGSVSSASDSVETLTLEIEELTKRYKELSQAEKDRKAAEIAQEKADRDKDALDFMKKNEEALKKNIEQLKIRAELEGKEVDQQEILNAMMSSYISLVTDNENVTANNPYSKKRLEELQAYIAGMEQVTEETELYKKAVKMIEDVTKDFAESVPLSEQIQTTIDALELERAALDDTSEAWANYTDKIAQLEELKTKAVQKEAEAAADAEKQATAEMFKSINDYFSEFADIVEDMTALIRSTNEDETSAQMNELNKQYSNGILSYEEYCDKKAEINRKAAREEYKLKMWEWSASLLQATSNIAQGVSAALAGVPPASYIMAALTAASGAAQIATLTANKPRPPSFANGGYVPGTSYSGDNVPIMANSRELILNNKEQAVIKSLIGSNGGGNSGAVVNMAVNVKNNNGSNVQTRLDKNGLQIIIDDMVNTGMARGNYNQSMQIASGRQKGARIL